MAGKKDFALQLGKMAKFKSDFIDKKRMDISVSKKDYDKYVIDILPTRLLMRAARGYYYDTISVQNKTVGPKIVSLCMELGLTVVWHRDVGVILVGW